jgi:hypothetical protein
LLETRAMSVAAHVPPPVRASRPTSGRATTMKWEIPQSWGTPKTPYSPNPAQPPTPVQRTGTLMRTEAQPPRAADEWGLPPITDTHVPAPPQNEYYKSSPAPGSVPPSVLVADSARHRFSQPSLPPEYAPIPILPPSPVTDDRRSISPPPGSVAAGRGSRGPTPHSTHRSDPLHRLGGAAPASSAASVAAASHASPRSVVPRAPSAARSLSPRGAAAAAAAEPEQYTGVQASTAWRGSLRSNAPSTYAPQVGKRREGFMRAQCVERLILLHILHPPPLFPLPTCPSLLGTHAPSGCLFSSPAGRSCFRRRLLPVFAPRRCRRGVCTPCQSCLAPIVSSCCVGSGPNRRCCTLGRR